MAHSVFDFLGLTYADRFSGLLRYETAVLFLPHYKGLMEEMPFCICTTFVASRRAKQ